MASAAEWRRRIVAGAFYAFAVWVAGVTSYAAYSPAANRQPALRDVVHSRLPPLDHTRVGTFEYGLPDKLACAVAAAVCSVLLLWGRSTDPGGLVTEWMLQHGAVLLMRSCTVVATTQPSPISTCRELAVHSDEVAYAQFPVHSLIVPVYCNDLMFSGHTATNVLAGMFALLSPAPVVAKVFIAALLFAAAAVSVAVRDHYTADVLCAAYVSVLLPLARRRSLAAVFG
eukprot:TRINITY_DN37192_c0_g1_i1.p1 TRINITY_DN37192_c0_g1~~TRINITY_DN37192_c0_g1_i1.p1  ORF type:complete len:228 (+),score=61.54 TRINITY_DN37192_c0_g1_i1:61-744(+)